jgi:nudix-type nucleoside diphosphatase (YffH/AdpP family)
MNVIIKKITRVFDDFFKVDRAVIQFEKFDGVMTDDVVRLSFERGKAVAVLLVNPDKKTVILTKQFRFPAYRADKTCGWLYEIVAGTTETESTPEETARREVLEEVGYDVENLKLLYSFFPTPGGSTEIIYLFYAEVTDDRRKNKGGGLAIEVEDIQVVELPIQEVLQLLADGQIMDAKTIIALQWLKENYSFSGH